MDDFRRGIAGNLAQLFAIALEFAKQSGDSGLMSNIMYRIGRVYLHDADANEALKWFQLGQVAAQDSGSSLAVAVLCGNEAWATR